MVCLALLSEAQIRTPWASSFGMPEIHHPGAASWSGKPSIFAGHFNTLTDVGTRPSSNFAGLQSDLSFGEWGTALFFNQAQSGDFDMLSIRAGLAYRVNFGKGKLAFGSRLNVDQISVVVEEDGVRQEGDPLLESSGSQMSVDLGAGFFYAQENMKIGLSANNLLGSYAAQGVEGHLTRTPSWNFLMLYDIPISNEYKLGFVSENIWVPNQVRVHEFSLQLKDGQRYVVGPLFKSTLEYGVVAGVFPRALIRSLKDDPYLAYSLSYHPLLKASFHQLVVHWTFNVRPDLKRVKNSKGSLVDPIYLH